MPKKYIIQIPNYTSILYFKKSRILTLIGPLGTKSLKLNIKLKISNKKKTLETTAKSVSNISNNKKKNLNTLKGTITALIKQSLIETSYILYQKLQLVGVGYRAFVVESLKNELIMFKLGYSHLIYFKIPKNLNIYCLKLTKLYIYGNSYHNITQTSGIIQALKYPEPYKGKGILYENQKIILKEGKKV